MQIIERLMENPKAKVMEFDYRAFFNTTNLKWVKFQLEEINK